MPHVVSKPTKIIIALNMQAVKGLRAKNQNFPAKSAALRRDGYFSARRSDASDGGGSGLRQMAKNDEKCKRRRCFWLTEGV